MYHLLLIFHLRPANRPRITGAALFHEKVGDLREAPDVVIANQLHEAVSLLRK